jgi:hypothetical protein
MYMGRRVRYHAPRPRACVTFAIPDQIVSLSEFVGAQRGALGSGKERPVPEVLAAEAMSSRADGLAAPMRGPLPVPRFR